MRYQLISTKTSGSRWSQHFAQIVLKWKLGFNLLIGHSASLSLLLQPILASSTLPFGNAIFTFASLVMNSRWFKNCSKGSSSQTEMCCAPQIYPCYTNTTTFLSCAFIFYSSACGLRDWLQTSLPMILPGGHHKVPCQVYPKPSTMGPPSCFNIYIWTYLDMTSIGNILTTSRCCKYCNGPLSTINCWRASQSCRLCQLLVSVVFWQTHPMAPEFSVWR